MKNEIKLELIDYLDLEEIEEKAGLSSLLHKENKQVFSTRAERFAKWLDLIDR